MNVWVLFVSHNKTHLVNVLYLTYVFVNDLSKSNQTSIIFQSRGPIWKANDQPPSKFIFLW